MNDRRQAPSAQDRDRLAAAMRRRRQENDDRWLARYRALSVEEQRREMDVVRDVDGSATRTAQRAMRALFDRSRSSRPRPRPRSAHRPARRAAASRTTSGSDPGEGGEPAEPPAAAVDAIAAAWTASLRRRYPDYSWDARP